uniref:M16 family metallopeptidase n=2 Tax=Prevotella sp. TaxID=59823 RepID=UPI004028375F
MKHLRTLLCVLVAALAVCVQAQKSYHYSTVAGDPMHARVYTLDNGLKVYMSVNRETPRLQTYIAVKTGSRNDPPETTGLAHYLEHLMFKGTTHFGSSNVAAEAPLLDTIECRFERYRHITDPVMRKKAYHEIDSISQLAARYNIPNEYDKLMASIGSQGSNAYTSEDVTCYVEDIPANEIDSWAKVQADRFKNMVIRGFHTELEAVYEEYNIGLGSDDEKQIQAMSKKLFPGHPYGTQSTIGTQEHLKNPSITNIKNYFHRYYVPNNVAICLAGDFDPDKTIAIIDKYFGDWKKSDNLSYPQYAPLKKLMAPVDTTVVGLEAPNVFMAWRTDAAASAQQDTLSVISYLLSNGKAGLFDLDLNNPMKVMGASAQLSSNHDYGMFYLYGLPKEGQDTKEVRRLMLGEIEKLKKGQFSDDLLPSAVNNMKLKYYQSLRKNDERADRFVNAFINDKQWDDEVHSLDRIAKMTKSQIVDFANRFFTDGYVTVFKAQGNDTTIHKIEKPHITPIPTNNDKQSEFLKEIVNAKPEPIQPKFVDFKRDLTVARTKKGLDYLYKKNTSDDIFSLTYHYPFGSESDNQYAVAADYLSYVGTDKLSNEKIQQQFFKLACSYNVSVGDDAINISISGLNSNMPAAVRLLENVLTSAKADKESYDKYVGIVLKARADAKGEQRANFSALTMLGEYGAYNPQLNDMSEKQLRDADPQALLDKLKNLNRYRATVMYFGPSDMKTVDGIVSAAHATPRKFLQEPEAKPYLHQATDKTEVWVAPYDAKNIYMTMYHAEGKKWTPEKAAIELLFNEYFGGGMNAIVFQELREARGLAYSAGARYTAPSAYPYKDTESFATYIITQNDKMMDCVNEFNNLLNDTPSREAGFKLARQSLIKSLSTARTNYENVFWRWLEAKKKGIDYDIRQKIYETLPKLTLNDVINFARENIANKPYRYLILGNEKDIDMDALQKLGPVRRLTTEEIFGY